METQRKWSPKAVGCTPPTRAIRVNSKEKDNFKIYFLVPFTCSSENLKFKMDKPKGEDGKPRPPALRDVAPSVLFAMGLPQPEEMDGVSLFEG